MRIKMRSGISVLGCAMVMLTACQTANVSVENGGTSSQTRNVPALISSQTPPLVSRIVFSPGEEKGWQAEYQTNWMDLSNVVCVANQTCFGLTEGDAILRTEDGGKSWNKLGVATMVVHGDSPFGCANGGFCLLIESKNGGNVWATHDGGMTWNQTSISPVKSPESLACPVLEKCLLVSRLGEIYSTQDGGKTWRSELLSNGIMYKKITCPNEAVCYVAGMVLAGEQGLVVKTMDSGLGWEQAGDSPAEGLRDISCATGDSCLSVGRFGIQITRDGGHTWQAISGGENGAQSVSCLSSSDCLIIDNQGQILTWDGVHLTRQPVEDEFSMRGVSCVPAGGCFMVGAFILPNFANTLKASLWLFFLAGVVSCLSPFVLPRMPGRLTDLAACSNGQEIAQVSRGRVLFHGIAFAAGCSLVFIALGVAASAIGHTLYSYKDWITRIGGMIAVFFGLQLSGWVEIPFLGSEIRKQMEPHPRLGYISSLFMGVLFSAGWTPGVGPILGIVLTFAGIGGSIARGFLLLAVFSLGFGLPFIITALAMNQRERWIRRMARLTQFVTLGAGIFLAGVGLLLILG